MPRFDLRGSTALVTGATRGLGRHFASVLAAAGARVAVSGRRLDVAEAVAAELDGEAIGVALEVTEPPSIKAAFDVAEERLGPVGILVNNAGVLIAKPALQHGPGDWRQVVGTDLDGAFYVLREGARRMAARGQGGAIVNIGSVSGERGGDMVPSYAAAKAGLHQLTKVMAMELAPQGIRVNALAPGYVQTDMSAVFLASERGRSALARVPMGRPAELSELDGALLLLASPAGSYLTGVVLPVDGGALVSVL